MRTLVITLAVCAAAALPGVAAAAPKPAAVTVYAGPQARLPAGADALAFFPRAVTIRVGQTVTWQFRGFHTVTFTGPTKPYPFVVPVGTQPAATDAAGHPFWWSGRGPLLAASPLTVQPQGGASISSPGQLRSSGLLRIITAPASSAPAPYRLTFTKPGLYRYQCAVHPTMRGVVRVLPRAGHVPTAKQVAAAGRAQLRRAFADLGTLGTGTAPPLTVLVGAGHASTGAEKTAFFPQTLTVPVGSTVTFRNDDETDIHTVTFGPESVGAEIEQTLLTPGPSGVLFNPLGVLPSEPPGAPATYDGSNHGNGYLNAGVLQPKGAPATAGPSSFSVTFTRAGTYRYECVIHANMDGTIVVR